MSKVVSEEQYARTIYPSLGPNPVALINACFVLVTFGQVSLIILLGTLCFSSRVQRRNPTLINLLVVTIFVTFPSAILYYSGHILDKHPSFGLCLTQATLKHGSDPMFIVASLALILEVLIEIRLLPIRVSHRTKTISLVALPYVTFVMFGIWAAALGASHRSVVTHQLNNLYCSVSITSFDRSIDILCAVIVVFTISLELYTHYMYRRIWQHVQSPRAPQGFNAALVIRLIGFTFLQMFFLVLLGLNFFVGSVATHVVPVAYEALMPLATFFIFGTSMDVMKAWKFWGRTDMDAPMLSVADHRDTETIVKDDEDDVHIVDASYPHMPSV